MTAASPRVPSPLVERGERGPVPLASRETVGIRLSIVLAAGSLMGIPFMGILSHAGAATRARPIGADLASLLATARSTSPEVAAAALDAEAAQAKVVSAGALPDPVASVENENFSRASTSGQGQTVRFRVMQEFPLWGKRELRSEIASYDALAAGHRRRGVEFSLENRIKSVFAVRNATFVALGLNRDIRKVVDDALRTARGRFAQNAASQEDVTKLEIEIADLDTEVARLDAQVLKTAAQLNALLSRRPDAPLARPNGFRRLPPDRLMTAAALADRAALDNAEVAEGEAKALAATAGRDLAGRNRYPDLSVGPMYSQENSAGTNHFGSAGVAASFSIPLQWDAKEADIRAAAAGQRAAEARVSALKLRVAGEVAGLVADYRASAKALAIMRNHHLPEAQVALKAAIGTAESDTPSLSDVFTASQRTLRIRLDILKLETEQQVAIAEIEKTIGGDL